MTPMKFNGICYPPPLNIDGVEPEHSKSVLIGIRDVISNSVKFTFLRWEMFYWRVAFTQFQLLLYHYEFEISYYYYNFKFRNKLNHAPKCFLRFRINLLWTRFPFCWYLRRTSKPFITPFIAYTLTVPPIFLKLYYQHLL